MLTGNICTMIEHLVKPIPSNPHFCQNVVVELACFFPLLQHRKSDFHEGPLHVIRVLLSIPMSLSENLF